MPELKLSGIGQPLTRVDKSVDDVITYSIDLITVLDQHEIVVNIEYAKYGEDKLEQVRSRRGVFLEITIPSISIVGAAPFEDRKVHVKYKTNKNNIRSVSFIVRAFN